MAKQLSADEENLKRTLRRRLIGAIALTIALVVVLPMVLESEPRPTGKDIELQIPSVDEAGVLQSRMPPATAAADPVAIVTPVPASAPVAMPAVASAPEHATPAETPAGAATQNSKVVASTAPSAVAESFVVQVGAYSNVTTAKQELASLKKWGFKAYTEKSGDVLRVRIGPYADREKADKVRGMVEKHGLQAVVMNAKS